MKNYAAPDVDAYIANASPMARPKLEELRKIIRTSNPDAVEKISWGIPFYRYHGLLAGFAAFKEHVGFGFAYALRDEDRKLLKAKGYATGKKTIQIRFDQKSPAADIRMILGAQAKINLAKRSRKVKQNDARNHD